MRALPAPGVADPENGENQEEAQEKDGRDVTRAKRTINGQMVVRENDAPLVVKSFPIVANDKKGWNASVTFR